ncbi:MAG: hypothetical protein Q8M92_04950, partial [Candidatus Subteraquimicrobiales bacterium]|nr:hypothetical protein [Candidatus Subteraquimicrobiales bacterium]
MRKEMRIFNKNNLPAFIVAVSIGLLSISKVFLIKGCYSFDCNDEVAHTFTEIPLIWDILFKGDIPFINFFNNFGTPVIGDPVINPFALHAITYLIFDGPLAATINKFFIITISILVLFFYYRKYFSSGISIICSVMVILMPRISHLWIHHSHQGAILYFALILIMQRRFIANHNVPNLLLLYLSLIVFMLSVSLNGFLFGMPFLIVNYYFESGRKLDRYFASLLGLIVTLFILSYPHFSLFFKWASLSARTSLDLGEFFPYSVKRLIYDIVFYNLTFPPLTHVSSGVFYSLPLLLTSMAGFSMLTDSRKEIFRNLFLGILPMLFVFFLLVNSNIRASIP